MTTVRYGRGREGGMGGGREGGKEHIIDIFFIFF